MKLHKTDLLDVDFLLDFQRLLLSISGSIYENWKQFFEVITRYDNEVCRDILNLLSKIPSTICFATRNSLWTPWCFTVLIKSLKL